MVNSLFSIVVFLTLLATAGPTRAAMVAGENPAQIAKELLPFYKELHRHPELSFQEFQTAKKLASALAGLGYQVTTGVGGTGVVGVLKNGKGPTVLVRSELHALPLVENTGSPDASHDTAAGPEGKTVGTMHACGHDIHLTSLVGTARWLSEHRNQWAGTLVIIGQPAEGSSAGPRRCSRTVFIDDFPSPITR